MPHNFVHQWSKKKIQTSKYKSRYKIDLIPCVTVIATVLVYWKVNRINEKLINNYYERIRNESYLEVVAMTTIVNNWEKQRKTFYIINWGHIVCIPFCKHITWIHRFNEMKACAECHLILICCINSSWHGSFNKLNMSTFIWWWKMNEIFGYLKQLKIVWRIVFMPDITDNIQLLLLFVV